MSTQALIGCACVVISLFFMVISFASPYWVESFEEFKGPFVKLGLWEFCFNDYTFYKDYNGKRWLGCFYIFADESRPIWEWVSPPWFISVQVMVSAALLFIFLSTVCLTLYVFKLFPKHLEHAVLIGNGGIQALCVVLILISLIVFGHYKEDRRWMPRPDMNLLSWSYGLCVMSGFFSLCGAAILLLQGRALYNDPKYRYSHAAVTYT